MSDIPLSPDIVRFRWAAVVIVAGSIALLAVYLINSGTHGIGPLVAASVAVWFTKLTIFGGTFEGQPFSPWELALLGWVLELLLSIVLLASIASFERLPLAGRAFHEAHLRANQALRTYPGVRRLAFWGVLIFVFLPLPGAGAFIGTLLGRLVGLSRCATLASVGIGAAAAVFSYAGIAVFLGAQWRNLLASPSIVIPSVIAIALFCWWAWLRVRKELERG
jgi:uncharacterized membrane protein